MPTKELVKSSYHLTEIERGEMMARAWEYRRRGMNHSAIGRELGVSAPTVKKLLEDYLHKIVQRDTVEEYFERDLATCDHLEQAANTLVDDPDPDVRAKGIDRVLKVMERRASMLGSDAAKKAEVTLTIRTEQEEAFDEIFKKWDKKNHAAQARLNEQGVYVVEEEHDAPPEPA